MDLVPRKKYKKMMEEKQKEEERSSHKKDVKLIREEMALLEEAKAIGNISEEGAKRLAPYTFKNVPTLFNIVYKESEKDYKEIYNRMLSQLELMNNGVVTRDKATEQLGQYLFNKLVKPNIDN